MKKILNLCIGDQENTFYFIMRGSIYYILPLSKNDKAKSVFAAQGIQTAAALASLVELKTQPNFQTEHSFHQVFVMAISGVIIKIFGRRMKQR